MKRENNRLFGYYRDKEILETIQEYKVLNTEQIRLIHFNNYKEEVGKRICQNRLKKLRDNNKIKHIKHSLDQPYIYFIDTKPEQYNHILMLNWGFIWWTKTKMSWEDEIYYMQYQKEYKNLICPDLFVIVKNKTKEQYKAYFFEMENSNKPFDKTKKYNLFFESNVWTKEWWSSKLNYFPDIIVFTTSPKRINKMNEIIKRDNKNKLIFDVYSIKEGYYEKANLL